MPARARPHRDLGRAIVARRHDLDLSQESLGERAGLDRTYIGGVERGERNPSFEALIKIANALELHISELVDPVKH